MFKFIFTKLMSLNSFSCTQFSVNYSTIYKFIYFGVAVENEENVKV